MNQSTARKTTSANDGQQEHKPHVLTLPLEDQQADRAQL